jgi:hypothetical protein
MAPNSIALPETVQILFTIETRPKMMVVGAIATQTLLKPVGVVLSDSHLMVNDCGRFKGISVMLTNPHTFFAGEVFALLFRDERLEGEERIYTVTLICQCSPRDAAMLRNAPVDALKLEHESSSEFR